MFELPLDLPIYSKDQGLADLLEQVRTIECLIYSKYNHFFLAYSDLDLESGSSINTRFDQPLSFLLRFRDNYLHCTYPEDFREGLESIYPLEIGLRLSIQDKEVPFFDYLVSHLKCIDQRPADQYQYIDLDEYSGAVLSSETIDTMMNSFFAILKDEVNHCPFWKKELLDHLNDPMFLFELVFGVPRSNLVKIEKLKPLPYAEYLSSDAGRMAQATVFIDLALELYRQRNSGTEALFFRLDIFPYVVLRYCIKHNFDLYKRARSLGLDSYASWTEISLRDYVRDYSPATAEPHFAFLRDVRTLPLLRKASSKKKGKKKTYDTYKRYLTLKIALNEKLSYENITKLRKAKFPPSYFTQLNEIEGHDEKGEEFFPSKNVVIDILQNIWRDAKPSVAPSEYSRNNVGSLLTEEWKTILKQWKTAENVKLSFYPVMDGNQSEGTSTFIRQFLLFPTSSFTEGDSSLLVQAFSLPRTGLDFFSFIIDNYGQSLFFGAEEDRFLMFNIGGHHDTNFIQYSVDSWGTFCSLNKEEFPIGGWLVKPHFNLMNKSLLYLRFLMKYLYPDTAQQIKTDLAKNILTDTELLLSTETTVLNDLMLDTSLPLTLSNVCSVANISNFILTAENSNSALDIINRLFEYIFRYQGRIEHFGTYETAFETICNTTVLNGLDFFILIISTIFSYRLSETDSEKVLSSAETVLHSLLGTKAVDKRLKKALSKAFARTSVTSKPENYLHNFFFWLYICNKVENLGYAINKQSFFDGEYTNLVKTIIDQVQSRWEIFEENVSNSLTSLERSFQTKNIKEQVLSPSLDDLIPRLYMVELVRLLKLVISAGPKQYRDQNEAFIHEGEEEFNIRHRLIKRFETLLSETIIFDKHFPAIKKKIHFYCDILSDICVFSFPLQFFVDWSLVFAIHEGKVKKTEKDLTRLAKKLFTQRVKSKIRVSREDFIEIYQKRKEIPDDELQEHIKILTECCANLTIVEEE